MATRPAYVWTGSDWDDIGDKRLGASVTALNTALGSKLDLAGGKILQIVRATDTGNRSTTSSTLVDVTGMSVTITPQKSDSALLIFAVFRGTLSGTSVQEIATFAITDSSNNALSGAEDGQIQLQAQVNASGASALVTPIFLVGYVSPANTSAVTYKLRFGKPFGSAGSTAQVRNDQHTGQMYAIEVSA
jgi:hypothetical protein